MDPLWDKNNKWITIVSNPIFEVVYIYIIV